MASDLNIKYGSKTGTGNQIKTGTDLAITPGNIYAARNSLDQVEVYLDTPQKDGETSVRSRLDPRIYVGSVSDILGDIPAGTTQEQINQMETAAVDKIWDNYDVWIDTSGDPTGVATTSSNGIMSSAHVTQLGTNTTNLGSLKTAVNNTFGNIKNAVDEFRIRIVDQTTWNNNKTDTTFTNQTLTVVLPTSVGTLNKILDFDDWTNAVSSLSF